MRNETRSSRSRPLDEALSAIIRLLERRKIPYMVMGEMALSVWGRVRVTQDVDVAIALDEPGEGAFLKALRKADFLAAAPRALFGHRFLICRYLKPTRGLPVQVDLFFVRQEYQRQALGRAVTIRLGGQHLKVISAEDLILYKLLADRPIDEMDVQAIVEEQRVRLNRKYLSRWAKHLGLSQHLKRNAQGLMEETA